MYALIINSGGETSIEFAFTALTLHNQFDQELENATDSEGKVSTHLRNMVIIEVGKGKMMMDIDSIDTSDMNVITYFEND